MRAVAFLTVGLCFALGATAADAACNIRDYLVKNVSNITRSGASELAFVLSSTEEEFDAAQKNAAGQGQYGIIGGSGSWAESRSNARKIASQTKFNSSSSYAEDLFNQTVDAGAIAAYRFCLSQEREAPGVELWLAERKGDIFTFHAFWIGSNIADGTPQVENGRAAASVEIVRGSGDVDAEPIRWFKGKTEKIIVARTANTDLVLTVSVGDQTDSIVIVPDPPAVTWKRIELKTTKLKAKVTGGNPGCKTGQASACLRPTKPGGKLDVKSVHWDGTSTYEDKFSARLNPKTEDRICIKITQGTFGCEAKKEAIGRLFVDELYPVVAR